MLEETVLIGVRGKETIILRYCKLASYFKYLIQSNIFNQNFIQTIFL